VNLIYKHRAWARLVAFSFTLSATSISLAQHAPDYLLGGAADDAVHPSGGEETAFLTATKAAADRMVGDMASNPTGDVDRDFVAMMERYQIGGVDFAVILLRHGKNAALKRLAQDFIVDQQRQIAEMRRAIGETQLTSMVAAPHIVLAPSDNDRLVSGDIRD
jgi:Domain of unknown function (DUF305)